jgi:hypothetical protein
VINYATCNLYEFARYFVRGVVVIIGNSCAENVYTKAQFKARNKRDLLNLENSLSKKSSNYYWMCGEKNNFPVKKIPHTHLYKLVDKWNWKIDIFRLCIVPRKKFVSVYFSTTTISIAICLNNEQLEIERYKKIFQVAMCHR